MIPTATPPWAGRIPHRRKIAHSRSGRGHRAQADPLSPGVTGPGADHAFLAAVLVAFARGFVERARNAGPDGVTVCPAWIFQVYRQGHAGTLHRDGCAATPALLARGRDRRGFRGIVEGLSIGAALADGECARRLRLTREQRTGRPQTQDDRCARPGTRRDKTAQTHLPQPNGSDPSVVVQKSATLSQRVGEADF